MLFMPSWCWINTHGSSRWLNHGAYVTRDLCHYLRIRHRSGYMQCWAWNNAACSRVLQAWVKCWPADLRTGGRVNCGPVLGLGLVLWLACELHAVICTELTRTRTLVLILTFTLLPLCISIRVGFLPAKTCFCHTWDLNRFKLAETWFKPAKTVMCSLVKFFWYLALNWQCNCNLLKPIHL